MVFDYFPSDESVAIPTANVNHKDILFKVFWTTVAIGTGLLGTALVEIHPTFAIPIASVVNWITAYIRQSYGVTSPDLKSVPTAPVNRHWPSG